MAADPELSGAPHTSMTGIVRSVATSPFEIHHDRVSVSTTGRLGP